MLRRLLDLVMVKQTQKPEPDLSPKGIADALAELMWLQRGSITIEVGHDNDQMRGRFGIVARRHAVTIPGGMTAVLEEYSESVTMTTPDGETITVTGQASIRLRLVWAAIQADAALEALGVPTTTQAHGPLRPSIVVGQLADAIGDIYDRSMPHASDQTMEVMILRNGRQAWEKHVAAWADLGCDVHALNDHNGYDADRDAANCAKGAKPVQMRVLTPMHGVLAIPYRPVWDGIQRRKKRAFADALGITRALPAHLPMPRGNAQAAYVLRMCRDAVARERDLKDANGAAIEPLVYEHLPKLMAEHAQAASTARPDQLAAVDATLMRGIERIRRAVVEALALRHAEQLDQIQTRVGFLEYRHPGGEGLPSAA
jgi:hypothetical protein